MNRMNIHIGDWEYRSGGSYSSYYHRVVATNKNDIRFIQCAIATENANWLLRTYVLGTLVASVTTSSGGFRSETEDTVEDYLNQNDYTYEELL